MTCQQVLNEKCNPYFQNTCNSKFKDCQTSEHNIIHKRYLKQSFCSCGAKANRDQTFDAFYCSTSKVWLEVCCGPDCCYCKGRPEFAP